MIPFEIFDSNALAIETLEFLQDGQIIGIGKKRLRPRERLLKTEEEFEKVAQDH